VSPPIISQQYVCVHIDRAGFGLAENDPYPVGVPLARTTYDGSMKLLCVRSARQEQISFLPDREFRRCIERYQGEPAAARS
jgi:hypothetical protein